MSIDRNARARLAALIRRDRRLTPAARLVWHGIAFGFVGARAYAWPSLGSIAGMAGVSRASVARALPELERLGYLTVHRSYARQRDRRGRTIPRRHPNRYVLPVPGPARESHRATGTKPHHHRETVAPAPLPAPLPDALAAALARLGHAIADRRGLDRHGAPAAGSPMNGGRPPRQ